MLDCCCQIPCEGMHLKELGHTILGNFSTGRIVIYTAGKPFSVYCCYVAMILQMKDPWSADLMFRAHN